MLVHLCQSSQYGMQATTQRMHGVFSVLFIVWIRKMDPICARILCDRVSQTIKKQISTSAVSCALVVWNQTTGPCTVEFSRAWSGMAGANTRNKQLGLLLSHFSKALCGDCHSQETSKCNSTTTCRNTVLSCHSHRSYNQWCWHGGQNDSTRTWGWKLADAVPLPNYPSRNLLLQTPQLSDIK